MITEKPFTKYCFLNFHILDTFFAVYLPVVIAEKVRIFFKVFIVSKG